MASGVHKALDQHGVLSASRGQARRGRPVISTAVFDRPSLSLIRLTFSRAASFLKISVKSATYLQNGMQAMFKSAAIAAAEAGALVVVTSIGAIALRLYSLAYRLRHP
jgi:hypothetical protein